MFYNVTMPADWFLIQRLIVWSTLARVAKLVSLQPTDTFCQHRSVTPRYADCKLFSVFLSLNTFGDGTTGRFWPVSPGNLFRSSSAILTNLPACSVAGPEEASQIFWHAEKLSWKMIAICSLLNRGVKQVEWHLTSVWWNTNLKDDSETRETGETVSFILCYSKLEVIKTA